jgi:hypothetical protein
MDFLKGYLTYIAGFGSLITGVVGLVIHFVEPTHAQALDYSSAIAMILGGITAIGLRRAVSKPN